MRKTKLLNNLIISILCAASCLYASQTFAADYMKIHAHPRIWVRSSQAWAGLREKIYGNPAMSQRWEDFIKACQKGRWVWGASEHGDFFRTLAQLTIGKIEGDNTWYSEGVILNNTQTLDLAACYECDNPYFLMAQAVVYDWLYGELTQEQKNSIKTNIEKACDKIILGPNSIDDNNKNEDFHNYHTGWIGAVVIAGIALYGDSPKATEYLDWGLSRLCGQKNKLDADGQNKNNKEIFYNFAKSMKATGGACIFEGPGYFKDAIPEIAWAIEAWDTATNRAYNMWGSDAYFKQMENAGYSIAYMYTPAMRKFKEEDSTYGMYNYVTSYNMTLLALLEARFSNGYFKWFIENNLDKVADWGSWDGGQTGRRAFYFLFFDPKVQEKIISRLPLDKGLGEYTILKSGWGFDDVYITFKAGYHWKCHAHSDHGNFQIYKGENILTGKSGWYDTSSWQNDSHRMAWFQQSISGNCIMIYDPNEAQAVSGGNVPNSGGQRTMNYERNPPFDTQETLLLGGGAMLAGGGHDVADQKLGVVNRYEELARYGKVIAQELNQPTYAYLKADITKGYTNAYSGLGDNISKKASLVQRSLVFLRPSTLVVYDVVNTTNSKFQVSFVTHQPYEPEINDGAWKKVGVGIHEFAADKARWDYEREFGTDRIIQKTLLPTTGYKYHVVGGLGYSCFIESTGKNYPPENKNEIDPELLPWRIVIQPNPGLTTDYRFLNVIEVADLRQADASASTLAKITSGDMVGADVTLQKTGARLVVLFSKSGKNINNVEFILEGSGPVKVLLHDLSPDRTYNIIQNGAPLKSVTATTQGTINFEAKIDDVSTFGLKMK